MPSKFHILGAGNIGCLIAASLPASCNVNLILRSQSRLVNYRQNGSNIRLRRKMGPTITAEREVPGITGYPADSPFENLIVATKAHQTKAAIRSVLPAINGNTNVLLIQNGLGVYEEIAPLFHSEQQLGLKPKFHLGILSHGVHTTKTPWEFNHAGVGTLKFASLDDQNSVMSQNLLQSSLNAEFLPKAEFFLAQTEKLIINAFINPLTAILGCRNGKLLDICSDKFLHDIVTECCLILRTHYGEMTNHDHTQGLMADISLNPSRMIKVVREVCQQTAANKSSMLCDVQRGFENESYYINGYLEKLGVRYGLPKVRNSTLSEMVRAKLLLTRAKEL